MILSWRRLYVRITFYLSAFALCFFLGPLHVRAVDPDPFISFIPQLTVDESIFAQVQISTNPSTTVFAEFTVASGVVYVPASGEDVTTISFENFPDQTVYVYVDSHEREFVYNPTQTNTTFAVDVSGIDPHIIFLKTQESTYGIQNNITGGDCTLFGLWDATTHTCTLTQDVVGVLGILSDDITLDGNHHTLEWRGGLGIGAGVNTAFRRNVTVKNLVVEGFDQGFGIFQTRNSSFLNNTIHSDHGMGMYVSFSSFDNLIEGNTISTTVGPVYGNTYSPGIYFGNTAQRTTVRDNSFSVTGNGIVLISSANNNKIYNNNFLSDPSIHSSGNVGNTLSQPLPIGGNYYSSYNTPLEGCEDININYICDNPQFFGNLVDFFPWKQKNAWKGNIVPEEYLAPITNTSSGVTKVYGSKSITAVVIKTLPNDWIVKVFSESLTNDGWLQIEDPTDGSTGWVQGGLARFPYIAQKQQEYVQKAVTPLSTKQERSDVIKQAVHYYFTNSNTAPSLYSGKDTVNFSIFNQIGFPEELALAIAAQETGGTYNFDNELVSFDYGHGAMQITFHAYWNEPNNFLKNSWDNRGTYSKIKIPLCENIVIDPNTGRVKEGTDEYKKCYKNTATQNTLKKPYDNFEHNLLNPKYKQYTNTVQSLYANIKDGLGNLQVDKYHPKCPRPDITISTQTFTCRDIEKILMVWGYNGITFKLDRQYLKDVAGQLANLSVNFPGVSYANTDHFVEKMRIANDNRKSVRVYSPVELSVVDGEGRVTGLVDGVAQEDIPNSAYFNDDEAVALLFPESGESYRIVGKDNGTYGIAIESVEDGETVVFNGIDLPIVTDEVHTYTVDHEALMQGLPGVTLEIDTDGDGVVDRSLNVGSELTDITPPEIEIGALKAEYILGESMTPHVTARDVSAVDIVLELDGVVVSNDQLLVLSKSGLNTLKITARDVVGNKSVKSIQWYVRYVFEGFNPPIQNDGSGIYKLNSTIPLKFSLFDYTGQNPPPATAALSIKKITDAILGDEEYGINNVGADQGNIFRYDAQAKQYIYNLSTKGRSVGTWQLAVILDDGSTHTVRISLR